MQHCVCVKMKQGGGAAQLSIIKGNGNSQVYQDFSPHNIRVAEAEKTKHQRKAATE